MNNGRTEKVPDLISRDKNSFSLKEEKQNIIKKYGINRI